MLTSYYVVSKQTCHTRLSLEVHLGFIIHFCGMAVNISLAAVTLNQQALLALERLPEAEWPNQGNITKLLLMGAYACGVSSEQYL